MTRPESICVGSSVEASVEEFVEESVEESVEAVVASVVVASVVSEELSEEGVTVKACPCHVIPRVSIEVPFVESGT